MTGTLRITLTSSLNRLSYILQSVIQRQTSKNETEIQPALSQSTSFGTCKVKEIFSNIHKSTNKHKTQEIQNKPMEVFGP